MPENPTEMVAIDHGISSSTTEIRLVIDSGVSKTLLSEKAWASVKPQPGHPKTKLKKNRTNFTPFGTNYKLPILGRTKCQLTAPGGKSIHTIVYVAAGETQSLLGLKDAEALGIIRINPDGSSTVRQLATDQTEQTCNKERSRADRQTDGSTDAAIRAVVPRIGKSKSCTGSHQDRSINPTNPTKQRPIAWQYKDKFKQHIEELQKEGVVSGPLDTIHACGWISNVVITHKNWTDKKIRVNLDTRPMAKAVKTSHYPIPTPQELRHNFRGSDWFSVVDLNHAFHQFELDEESKNLFARVSL